MKQSRPPTLIILGSSVQDAPSSSQAGSCGVAIGSRGAGGNGGMVVGAVGLNGTRADQLLTPRALRSPAVVVCDEYDHGGNNNAYANVALSSSSSAHPQQDCGDDSGQHSTRSAQLANAASAASTLPLPMLSRNLTLFVVLKVLGSFDSGAFSATLNGENGITEDWGLSVAQQGTLSSSVFLGNMIGCAFAGHLFSLYSAKLLLVISLMVHGFFTFLFASSETYEFALLCRFFIGVTLAFIVVYTPIWVDEFAPKTSAATWMALQNAGVPVGIMLGFVIGGLLPTYTSVSWEWAFYAKTIIMVPIVALVAKTERRSLDSSSRTAAVAAFQQHQERQQQRQQVMLMRQQRAEAATTTASSAVIVDQSSCSSSSPLEAPHLSTSQQHYRAPSDTADTVVATVTDTLGRFKYIATSLLTNGVYVANVVSLSSLYFVVSGLQTFVTSYLRGDPFNASMETIVVGFGCAVVTAPVFGVICGGVLLDRIGGYHGNILKASKFALAWGTGAAVVSVVCVLVSDTGRFLLVVWILLFCGGAIIPPGSGINMASLPEALRPSGSSLSQMAFNFLGNFSGPLVCGLVSQWTGSLTWGIRSVFAVGVLGVLPMGACTIFAARRYGEEPSSSDLEEQHPQGTAAGEGDASGGGGVPPSGSGGDVAAVDDGDIVCGAAARDGIGSFVGDVHLSHLAPALAGTLSVPEYAGEVESVRHGADDEEMLQQSRSQSRASDTKNSSLVGAPPVVVHLAPISATGSTCSRSQTPQAPVTPLRAGMLAAAAANSGGGSVVRRSPSSLRPVRVVAPSAQRHHHHHHHRDHRAADGSSGLGTTPDRDELLNSGNFNLSFPYQHNFGLDVVRGILHSEHPLPKSMSSSRAVSPATGGGGCGGATTDGGATVSSSAGDISTAIAT